MELNNIAVAITLQLPLKFQLQKLGKVELAEYRACAEDYETSHRPSLIGLAVHKTE